MLIYIDIHFFVCQLQLIMCYLGWIHEVSFMLFFWKSQNEQKHTSYAETFHFLTQLKAQNVTSSFQRFFSIYLHLKLLH